MPKIQYTVYSRRTGLSVHPGSTPAIPLPVSTLHYYTWCVTRHASTCHFAANVRAVKLKRVAIAAPLVPFLPFRLLDARVAPVLGKVLPVVVHALDDLIALAPLALCVFALEQEAVCSSCDERDGDVHQDDAMAKPKPGLVLATVLQIPGVNDCSRQHVMARDLPRWS